jgi:hypothetical protein
MTNDAFPETKEPQRRRRLRESRKKEVVPELPKKK